MTPTTFNGIVLDKLCKYCKGTGRLIEDIPVCPYCGGAGMELTAEGKELVCFLARHLSPKIEIGIK